ncbi:MAG: RNA polymerase sigma factor [Chloroflexales bacterium]|nr:RNA polymerase sigma factor [Chloroflexales bacterium]
MSHQHTVATLYSNHADGIRRYLYRRVFDISLAEDLCNDVFVRVLEGLPNYHDRGLPIEAWLYRIAHDKAVDAIRYLARRPNVRIQDYDAHVLDESSIADDEHFRTILEHLSEEQRRVIIMRYRNDMTFAQIARSLKRSEGAVKQLRNRGLQTLRETYVSSA